MVRQDIFDEIKNSESTETSNEKNEYRVRIVWFNVFVLGFLHITAPYGIYLSLTSAKLYTTIFSLVLYQLSMIGVTAGVHRLWSHRSYKANLPLKIILMILETIAYQGSIFVWARDHRVHHKYSETDADPHNATRGFFFAHIGWMLCKKHPELAVKGKGINIDDLLQDPVVTFQHKYYFYLVVLLSIFVPTIIPVYFWNETWRSAFFIAAVCRHVISTNATSLINSAAHLYGQKPYDIGIHPSENKLVSVVATGEGWHNYHHTFPWDYKASELGQYRHNFAAAFIDFFAWIGWAYDLKTVSAENVRDRVMRTGDGTHDVWGWGDKDQTLKERDAAILTHTRTEKVL